MRVERDTTYKAQYRDPITLSWRDIQKRYPSEQKAREAAERLYPLSDVRVVEINPTGRIFGI